MWRAVSSSHDLNTPGLRCAHTLSRVRGRTYVSSLSTWFCSSLHGKSIFSSLLLGNAKAGQTRAFSVCCVWREADGGVTLVCSLPLKGKNKITKTKRTHIHMQTHKQTDAQQARELRKEHLFLLLLLLSHPSFHPSLPLTQTYVALHSPSTLPGPGT